MVPELNVDGGEIVLVNPEDGYALFEKPKTSGTPTLPEPKVAVTVNAELPATNVVAPESDSDTTSLTGLAME